MLTTILTILILANDLSDDDFADLTRWVADYEDDDPTNLWGFSWAVIDWEELREEEEAYGDRGSHDLSDDGYALASAGWGTDEDYGCYGGDEW